MSIIDVLLGAILPAAILMAACATGGLTLWCNKLQREVDELRLAQSRTEASVWPLLEDESACRRWLKVWGDQ